MTPDKTPSDDAIAMLYSQETGFLLKESNAAILDFARAVLAKWGSPVVAVEPGNPGFLQDMKEINDLQPTQAQAQAQAARDTVAAARATGAKP